MLCYELGGPGFSLGEILILRSSFVQQVSRDMGVHEATLRGWLRDEGKLRAFADDIELSQGLAKRKRVRTTRNPHLDAAVFDWTMQMKNAGVPLSGPVIKSQALLFNQQTTDDTAPFQASNGWLQKFQKRHSLQSFSLHDEGASIDKKDADEHISQCYHLIQEGGYTVDQVYKADETGLHWRQPPRKIISPRSSHIQDFNEQNERLTVLVCTNRSGSHQLKPLVIGKYRSPQCFHHVKVDCLPVVYDHSIKGLMTATTLENWFHKSFVPAVKAHLEERQLEAKALLLLDSCPAHLPAETLRSRGGKIVVHYLLKNTTALTQPMDQSVIHTLKTNYKRELIQKMVDGDTPNVISFLKEMTIRDAVNIIHSAWAAISKVSLRKCWEKGLPMPDSSLSDDEGEKSDFWGSTDKDIQDSARQKIADFLEVDEREVDHHLKMWVDEDANLPTAQEKTDEDTSQEALARGEPTPSEEQKQEEPPSSAPSTQQALKNLQVVLDFWTSQGKNLEAIQVETQMRKVREIQAKQQKQTELASSS